ncbi:MAG: hypothetical protein CSA04_05900 [Bacteroidetes bacterium]|nr:MAG: hypothetical protein CSA04_05900 [Bacteroidota bacterium]
MWIARSGLTLNTLEQQPTGLLLLPLPTIKDKHAPRKHYIESVYLRMEKTKEDQYAHRRNSRGGLGG